MISAATWKVALRAVGREIRTATVRRWLATGATTLE